MIRWRVVFESLHWNDKRDKGHCNEQQYNNKYKHFITNTYKSSHCWHLNLEPAEMFWLQPDFGWIFFKTPKLKYTSTQLTIANNRCQCLCCVGGCCCCRWWWCFWWNGSCAVINFCKNMLIAEVGVAIRGWWFTSIA